MATRVQRIRDDEVAGLRGRVQELETLLADALIGQQQAVRRRNELETDLADLVRQLEASESGRRYAIGQVLDEAWCLDHARAKATEAAELLIARCREVATSREMIRWAHDTGGEVYHHAAEMLCWKLDEHTRLNVPTIARGRELLAMLQALGFVRSMPQAMGMQFAIRDLDALQMVEEARVRKAPNGDEIAAAIREGEVA